MYVARQITALIDTNAPLAHMIHLCNRLGFSNLQSRLITASFGSVSARIPGKKAHRVVKSRMCDFWSRERSPH